MQTRLLAARAGVRAEDEQMSERLSVVEPPVIPDSPSWPDRLKLALGGIGGGLAFGFILAYGIELLLRPIRGPAALYNILGAAPLGVIPIVKPKTTKKRKWSKFAFPRVTGSK